ncbi:SDR family NAD(P)-dependent oxidoreductase [Paenibacillus sp. HJL G12]|uniref:SDR family NAD(P)-dependent oxidoreductase n=1 Tax=Paenibacillus dendrobii TaxID=2691084 RepID=A0A7X3LI52_9BACL|nr:SDR family oxidoreductase [Paenibacillus dendrobii]MWV43924.1 SDR family NAD(P)-dependent oxidoreductase [Paenibacillus dendrobii]
MSLLTNRVAIVTGAGTGLGRAAAIRLAAEGAEVVLVGRRQEKLEEVAQIIEQTNGRAIVYAADVTNPDEVERLRDHVLAQAGRVDVLINNAGGTGTYSTIHDMDFEVWDQVIRLNLYSSFIVTHAFLPVMRKQQYGRIVSITSAMANFVYAGLGAYSAAKAGLEGLMRTVADEEKDSGILVNMFDPGNLKTEQNPYGEGDPASVVDTIADLASLPENGSNGQVFRANE